MPAHAAPARHSPRSGLRHLTPGARQGLDTAQRQPSLRTAGHGPAPSPGWCRATFHRRRLRAALTFSSLTGYPECINETDFGARRLPMAVFRSPEDRPRRKLPRDRVAQSRLRPAGAPATTSATYGIADGQRVLIGPPRIVAVRQSEDPGPQISRRRR